jgi:hypothetical protein
MKKTALLALLCLGLSQEGLAFSWKEALKEVADAALASQQGGGQPTSEAGASGQPRGTATTATNSPSSKGGAIQANPDDPLMKQGMWQDSRTGLIWSRCEVGQKWDGTACQGITSSFNTLEDAMVGATEVQLGGFRDWRVPTLDEINGIRHCDNEGGFYKEGIRNEKYLGDDGLEKTALNSCEKGGDPEIGSASIFPVVNSMDESKGAWLFDTKPGVIWRLQFGKLFSFNTDSSFPSQLRVVRGGKPTSAYENQLAQAQAKNGQQVAARKVTEQAKQQQAAEYERKTQELRKTVKPGDRIAQGLVLAVNGELVQVQTYERICASKTGLTCWRYEVVVSGEKWLRRDELRPIVTAR